MVIIRISFSLFHIEFYFLGGLMKRFFNKKNTLIVVIQYFLCASTLNAADVNHELEVSLGKLIFEDKTLSQPVGQSCASCHVPSQADAQQGLIVSPGATSTLFGNRNAPSITYSMFTTPWYFNTEDETWIGGFFWDGRAKTMHEQAKGPFLNPLEMGNGSAHQVVSKIQSTTYQKMFETVYGKDIWNTPEEAFNAVATALVAYQKSESFAPRFTSKYDAYLQNKTTLTDQEMRGLKLFEAEDKGNCAACHPSQIGEKGELPLFTDFSYDNLGVPKQTHLPFYAMSKKVNPAGKNYVDVGLADNPNIKDPQAQLGKFKVPTLRNIAKTAPYMHNGVFLTLKESVEFYNTRDVDKKWAKAEVSTNVNKDELGNLKLTNDEIDDLVSFLQTLDDGFIAKSS